MLMCKSISYLRLTYILFYMKFLDSHKLRTLHLRYWGLLASLEQIPMCQFERLLIV